MTLPNSGWTRMLYALVVGALAGWAGSHVGLPVGVLVGLTTTAGLFTLAGWATVWPMNATRTKAHVSREDYTPLVDELVVLGFVAASVLGIIALQLGPKSLAHVEALLTIAAVFLTWASIHFMYAVRYADVYYSESGGIDFNSSEPPQFSDFLYFSYNLGMTYQVSDTAVSSRSLRKIIIRHCLLSYGFGVLILATAINLAVGLVSG